MFSAESRLVQECVIVPTAPVNGPLKPSWPSNLSLYQQDYLLSQSQSSYLRANEFLYDAFGTGPEHAFHYWESADEGTPMQFQGPVLDFPPYGQVSGCLLLDLMEYRRT